MAAGEAGMKWERRKSDDGCHRLGIEADWPEIAGDYEEILADYRRIRVPGFRSGKVPRTVIETRFQKEIMGDLSQRAARRLGRRAVREAGVEVLGAAEAEDIECVKGRPFRATVFFHPMPEIDLPDLGSLITGDADVKPSISGEHGPSDQERGKKPGVEPGRVPPPAAGSAGGIDPRDRISLKLLDLVRFDIPDGLVKQELALDGEDGVSPGSAQWKAAADRIRLMLILKRIAKEEGIEVDQADVDSRIALKAEEFRTTAGSLQGELSWGGGMPRLKDMLLAESTLEYLMDINNQEGRK